MRLLYYKILEELYTSLHVRLSRGWILAAPVTLPYARLLMWAGTAAASDRAHNHQTGTGEESAAQGHLRRLAADDGIPISGLVRA
jgi:hypothetical protein